MKSCYNTMITYSLADFRDVQAVGIHKKYILLVQGEFSRVMVQPEKNLEPICSMKLIGPVCRHCTRVDP